MRRRVLKAAGLFVLGVLVLLVVGTAGLLGSESGSRWVLAQVPGLQVEQFSGRLGGEWATQRLVWEQGATRVEVNQLQVDWSVRCLARLTLCIDRLHAAQVAVQLPTSGPAQPGPVTLPELKLPLRLKVADLQVGSFQLDGVEQLQGLILSAHWTETGLEIDNLTLHRQGFEVALKGRLITVGDWPLSVQATLGLPAPEQQPWALAMNLTGNLRQRLDVQATSTGYLAAELAGSLQPLAEHLPAKLRMTAERFMASAELPKTLALEAVQLNAAGDLDHGYQIQGQANVAAEGGPIGLQLKGLVNASGLKLDGLDLNASDKQQLHVGGTLDWSKGLAADAALKWVDFPWHRLLPDITEPAVTLHALTAEVSYTDGRYLGNISADLDGPAGAFSVLSPFSGDLSSVHLPQLELKAGKGSASGNLDLGFADGVSWNTRLDLQAIDPAYWVAQLPGQLAGVLNSKGSLRNEQLQASADLDLKGRLRGQPVIAQLKGSGAGQRWSLDALDLRLGDNRISGRASLEKTLAAQLDLNLPKLAQLWPQLQGAANGTLNVAGTLQAPQGQLSLKGQQLALEQNRIQTLDLFANLDATQRGKLDLKASGIASGDHAIGNLMLDGQGNLQSQQLNVDLQGPLLKLALGFEGGLNKNDWRGRLASGEVSSGGQNWHLQSPARLERLANGSVNLGAHCWLSAPASLCTDDQQLLPEPRVRLHLKQFPLSSLAPWLPADFAWQGHLNADVQLDVPAAGPKGQVQVDASGGTLRVREKDQWLDFPYSALTFTANLTPKLIDSQLNFQGGKLGELSLQARINPLPTNKPLIGEFRLAGLDTAIARPFLPMVERLAGRVDGSGRLEGTLQAPRVVGNLTLSGGEISGGQLPVSFEALQLNAAIAGESLSLDGHWKSGAKGQGQLAGTLNWAQGLAVDLQLRGSALPVTVDPYAALEAEPDLHLRMASDHLALSGTIRVPRGAITARELPPSTVRVSDDAVIVGEQHAGTDGKAPPGLAMSMDIDVDVGSEKLTFSGFGLNANLLGHVHIGDNLDTRGELRLEQGRYRAYGQNLTIRRARLLFAGPLDQPYLDIEAIRTTGDVIAGIRLTGSAEQPSSEVFSEPAMSQEQALSYLVLGRPLGGNGDDNNVLAQAALGLGLAGSAGVTSRLADNLGIKDFQLDTQGSGSTTSVVASGNLSKRLTLRYGVGVFDPVNTIALRYELTRRLYLEAASGLASSLDIFYKRDF